MQILQIKLNHLNQRKTCQTPSFFISIEINNPLSQHLPDIHAYFQQYLPPFFSIQNLTIIQPWNSQIDYDVPLFVYLESGAVKAPVFEAKYQVKNPQILLKLKGKKRPQQSLIIVKKGKLIQTTNFQKDQTIEQILNKLKISGDCFNGDKRISPKYSAENFNILRAKDSNIYFRIEEHLKDQQN